LDITEAVKPPRAVFVNFPLGHQTGKPFQPELQKSIVKDALNALYTIKEPGTIVALPYRWAEDDSWEKDAPVD
jgi:D-proline reductase (dithiol) PrdB